MACELMAYETATWIQSNNPAIFRFGPDGMESNKKDGGSNNYSTNSRREWVSWTGKQEVPVQLPSKTKSNVLGPAKRQMAT